MPRRASSAVLAHLAAAGLAIAPGMTRADAAMVGTVSVRSSVAGADVYLDDPSHTNPRIGTTPLVLQAAPGEHVVSVVAPGYEEANRSVSVEQGRLVVVQADLERVGYGYLSLDGDVDDMDITIDGENGACTTTPADRRR